MGFAVRVRSAGQKYGPTCHQRDHADVTEFVTLVRLSSLGQHVGVLALAGYKRRKSALTAGPIAVLVTHEHHMTKCLGILLSAPEASLKLQTLFMLPTIGPLAHQVTKSSLTISACWDNRCRSMISKFHKHCNCWWRCPLLQLHYLWSYKN